MSDVDTTTIRDALALLGVQVLAISRPADQPGRIVVYLHGNAGRAQQADALHAIRLLPGVARVSVSPSAWSILVVDLDAQ